MATQHILVPFDFSEHAEQTLDYAIDLAHKLTARLTLLHVVHVLSWMDEDFSEQMIGLEADAERSLKAPLQRVREAGLEGAGDVQQGVPWQEIVEVAEAQHVDLIIMSTHGYTGLRHILLGSVAERVVRHAPCPVLVTRRVDAC